MRPGNRWVLGNQGGSPGFAPAAGTLPTVWGDQKRFTEAYLARFPGYYDTGGVGLHRDGGPATYSLWAAPMM